MGLLDQVLGGMLGPKSSGGGNSAIADVLTELLAPQSRGSTGAGGGLGDLIGSLTGESRPDFQQQPQRQGRTNEGLGGLLESFSRSGHGDIADSWVSSGQNQPIAPNQLERAIDADTIDRLVRKTGLSREELLQQLSQHLPNAVDQLTPDGRRPTPEAMGHW